VEVAAVANRQPWPDDLKAQARALYLADGAKLASEVTQIPVRTVRQWAKDGNWRQQAPATGHVADQDHAPHAPGVDGAAAGGNSAEGPAAAWAPPPNLPRELARDLALAGQVYRAEVERFLAGTAKSSSVRDAAVALAVLTDKVARHGPAGTGSGRAGDFTWAEHLADNPARGQRLLAMLRELLAAWAERARAATNGQAHA
jgi:hypothetical protein